MNVGKWTAKRLVRTTIATIFGLEPTHHQLFSSTLSTTKEDPFQLHVNMAEKRKLLNEIDKCYKKIDEGFEIFDDIMEKMNEANSDNQREKFQDDLKKEIKKLQRLRDQIKGWQNSSEIKDKDSLSKFRKLIEQRMEIFKDVERENKTKPHSKQGLSAEDKLDPREKEKCETIEWLNCQIRRIQDEIDRTESKLETMSSMADSNRKRGKKDEAKKNEKEKSEELRKHLERVKFHLLNLEVCMRMINNEKLEIKVVLGKLKEPLEMYIDALDPENDDDPESLDPEDIYEELNFGTYLSQLGGIITTTSVDEEKGPLPNDNGCSSGSPQISGKEKQPQLNLSSPTIAAAPIVTSPESASADITTTVGTASATTAQEDVFLFNGTESQPRKSKEPQEVRSAWGSTYPRTSSCLRPCTSSLDLSQPGGIITTTSVDEEKGPPLNDNGCSSGSLQISGKEKQQQLNLSSPKSPTIAAAPVATSPESASAGSTTSVGTASGIITTTSVDEEIGPPQNDNGCSSGSPQISGNEKQRQLNLSSPTIAAVPVAASPEPVSADSTTLVGTASATTAQEDVFLFNGTDSQPHKSKEPQETVIPPWLGASPLGMVALNEDLNYQLQMLDATLTRCPVQMDSEKTRSYLPKMPCQTPPYYPQAPLPNADSLEYYLRLSVEALFFTFYYMEGSRAQLLAAKALKKLSWRFHTKYLMWFQRHEEPKQITDDFEQGTYVYFDFEKWVQRKKEQFTFEYKYLEDKDFE
ncbi:hypothetical protein niasHT_007490 [Heterodera trifolii]|uniref:CCR4-NOT transcription complex subunit 3 n=1 Tax=Heterodera trifolii TaxID=157864 RepID=A0ABD2LQB7_9BILA